MYVINQTDYINIYIDEIYTFVWISYGETCY